MKREDKPSPVVAPKSDHEKTRVLANSLINSLTSHRVIGLVSQSCEHYILLDL